MTVTSDWQMEYGGVLLGASQPYRIVKVDGLADYPALRTSDRTRLRRHGMLPGSDFLAGRSIMVTLEVEGGTTGSLAGLLATLKAAMTVGEDEAALTLQIPGVGDGGVMRMLARPRRFASTVDVRWRFAQPSALLELFATDPRIYDNDQSSQAVGLAAAVTGLSWNLTWNLDWGGTVDSNLVVATNQGSFPTPMVVRFDGPVTNPKVENNDTGAFLDFSADSGIVVAAGEYLEVDTEARTVLLNGTASRYSKLSSDSTWFDLAPGDNHLKFRGSTSGAPTMTVTWRSAWL